MKSRIVKSLTLVIAVCMLMACLTGCETLDYREAVQLYNSRQYEKAAALFESLGDYEDSAQLLISSRYWIATEAMDAGNYEEALGRFLKLGSFEDSADRVTECKYQLAIAAFNEARYADAEEIFLELQDYRLTGEYLRQLNWQKLYDHIVTSGSESGGCYVLSSQAGERTVNIMVDMTAPENIVMAATWSKDMGYSFSDMLTLTLPRDSTEAEFTAHSAFTMDFNGSQIGSEQTGTGKVALSSYTAGTTLAIESFDMTVTDNLGNTITSQDPADSKMNEAMVQNLAAILEMLPITLATAGAENIF